MSFRSAATSCALFALVGAMGAAMAGPSVFPTGVTTYDPTAAYNSDILYATGNATYLIDMDGNLLRQWNKSGMPARIIDPALAGGAKGEIGLQLSDVPKGSNLGGLGLVPGQQVMFRNQTIGYLDWSGQKIWDWGTQAPGGAALQHHDWQLLSNGDTLVLTNKVGKIKGFGDREMLDDVIYDIDKSGHTVWSWAASDHMAEFGFSPSDMQYLKSHTAADYLHMNDMQALGPNHWGKSGDSRFAADNILISSRNAGFLAIIDRKTGKIVWRVGPHWSLSQTPYDFGGKQSVPFALDRLSGQHDANMIAEGLPGAGNILVFDNEGESGYPPIPMPVVQGSRVLEINPVTQQVVWMYTGTKATFFSPYISSVQRLPNGNTLIDEGIDGRFLQVTPQHKIVWEYVSPYLTDFMKNPMNSIVYRIQAVPYDWLPAGTTHAEIAVTPPPRANFRVSSAK